LKPGLGQVFLIVRVPEPVLAKFIKEAKEV
jgi:hypothetical protein